MLYAPIFGIYLDKQQFLVLSNLKYQFIFLICNISKGDWQACCWTQLDTFPQLF
jgi:hypothetical protein